jgi:hypothetical protein
MRDHVAGGAVHYRGSRVVLTRDGRIGGWDDISDFGIDRRRDGSDVSALITVGSVEGIGPTVAGLSSGRLGPGIAFLPTFATSGIGR